MGIMFKGQIIRNIKMLARIQAACAAHGMARYGFASVCVVLGLLMFATTLWGIRLHFSPALFGDQWDGGLDFYVALVEGDATRWWGTHNEHRLLIPRLFFYADFAWFGGRNLFALPAIAVALAVLGGLVYRVFCLVPGLSRPDRWAAGGLAAALLFSWTQHENLLWGFQIQFVLVFLFALAAFALLWRASQAARCWGWVMGAGVMASASALCMINGLLCFPLVLLMAWWLRLPRRPLALLGAWALLMWGVYFYGFTGFSHGPAAPPIGLPERLLAIGAYTLCYLGGPLAAGLELPTTAHAWLAGVAGAVLLGLTGFLALKVAYRDRCTPALVLVLTILFVLASAGATAVGRSSLGFSFTSRYATPALVAWLCLLLGLLSLVSAAPRSAGTALEGTRWGGGRCGLVLLVLAVLGLLLPGQVGAVTPDKQAFIRTLGGLAARYSIFDQRFIQPIYHPDPAHIRRVVSRAANAKIPYGDLPLASEGVLPILGHVTVCEGSVDGLAGTTSPYYTLHGWIAAPNRQVAPRRLLLTDHLGRVVGEAVGGKRRADVAREFRTAEQRYGWQGFARRELAGQAVTRFNVYGWLGENRWCRMGGEFTLPPALLDSRPPENPEHQAALPEIVEMQGWSENPLVGISVPQPWRFMLGSLHGHVGRIVLKLPQPALDYRFHYMTGPEAQDQYLQVWGVDGTLIARLELPPTDHLWDTRYVRAIRPIARLEFVDARNTPPSWLALGWRNTENPQVSLLEGQPKAMLLRETGGVTEQTVEGKILHMQGWMPVGDVPSESLLLIVGPVLPKSHSLKAVTAPVDLHSEWRWPFHLTLHYPNAAAAADAAQTLCLGMSASVNAPAELLAGQSAYCRGWLKPVLP